MNEDQRDYILSRAMDAAEIVIKQSATQYTPINAAEAIVKAAVAAQELIDKIK